MRAVVITRPGGPEALQMIDVPSPEPGPGEIRIRVAAAAVNPVDATTRAGVFHALGWIDQPEHTGIGWDVAGVVDALGPDIKGPPIGTRVAAILDTLNVPLGTYAEQVLVPADSVAGVPGDLDLTAAATIPANATTADQALDLIDLRPGSSLLVTGAAGGVGGYALALATRRGLRVTGLARAGDSDFVQSTGAELITELPEASAFDAVLDTAGLVDAALAAVRDGGRYIGVSPGDVPTGVRGISTAAVKVHHDGARLAGLLVLASEGALATRIADALPLADAAEAHRLLAKGGVRGRYVLVP